MYRNTKSESDSGSFHYSQSSLNLMGQTWDELMGFINRTQHDAPAARIFDDSSNVGLSGDVYSSLNKNDLQSGFRANIDRFVCLY